MTLEEYQRARREIVEGDHGLVQRFLGEACRRADIGGIETAIGVLRPGMERYVLQIPDNVAVEPETKARLAEAIGCAHERVIILRGNAHLVVLQDFTNDAMNELIHLIALATERADSAQSMVSMLRGSLDTLTNTAGARRSRRPAGEVLVLPLERAVR